MKQRMTRYGAVLAVLVGAGTLQAHHSGSMFGPTPVWLQGTIVSYEAINPHATLVLEHRTADGRLEHWTVEGPDRRRIELMGTEPEVGDVVEVCGFALRDDVSRRSTSPDPYGLTERFVHGKALVMSDGHMESFGPYGKLDSCLRASDEMATWLDFLNSQPHALIDWCNGLGFNLPTVAPPDMLDEINRRLGNPCR